LTKSQTASFLTSDIDPLTMGYIIAIASDPFTGCPIDWDYLIGDEYVKFASGHFANLGAEAFSGLGAGDFALLPGCAPGVFLAPLAFGVQYDRAPFALAVSNIPSPAEGNDTLLIIDNLAVNLATGGATGTNIFGLLFDDAENGYSFAFTLGCQRKQSLSDTFPRTVPRLSTLLPFGRSGWMKFWPTNPAVGIVGSVINRNTNAAPGAFNDGHNLHKLTLTPIVPFFVPIFPTMCM
jgi:hypothetical protein